MAENEQDESKKTAEVVAVEEEPIIPLEEGAILEASENDVISGRGAAVNLNAGNRRFRDLCFKRKPEFDAASHAAKRRIATEIVVASKANGARFLKRKVDKGPWYEMSDEKAIHKAAQVMRDYQRPDRMANRQSAGNGRKRERFGDSEAEILPVASEAPVAPIVENPYGVHDHDVISGRGAMINGHVGNIYFRKLCLERKAQFDAGNYSEKRTLASDVVNVIRSQDPPGRFLKRATKVEGTADGETVAEGEWVELSDDRAVHKACQVMRDIARPDRQGDRRRKKKKTDDGAEAGYEAKDSMTILAETTAEASAVEEAVAATEEALDKALDSVPKKDDMPQAEV